MKSSSDSSLINTAFKNSGQRSLKKENGKSDDELISFFMNELEKFIKTVKLVTVLSEERSKSKVSKAFSGHLEVTKQYLDKLDADLSEQTNSASLSNQTNSSIKDIANFISKKSDKMKNTKKHLKATTANKSEQPKQDISNVLKVDTPKVESTTEYVEEQKSSRKKMKSQVGELGGQEQEKHKKEIDKIVKEAVKKQRLNATDGWFQQLDNNKPNEQATAYTK